MENNFALIMLNHPDGSMTRHRNETGEADRANPGFSPRNVVRIHPDFLLRK